MGEKGCHYRFMLNKKQKERYSRNILLPELGEVGQEKLLNARVLVVGAGGLGCPLLSYLATSGVGHIGIIDDDIIEENNLQRQILFNENDLEKNKAECATEKLRLMNSEVEISSYAKRLTNSNAKNIVANYDIIADCTDNFRTRFLLNETALKEGKVLASAAIIGFKGYVSIYSAGVDKKAPCYQCFHSNMGHNDKACYNQGVLGSAVGVIASLQASEIIKTILEIGKPLNSKIAIFDMLESKYKVVNLQKDKSCKTCSV
jgi:adenylyltransferase/sulfurtransferase